MNIRLILIYVTIGLSIIGIFLWVYYYVKYKQPAAIATLTWLFNLLAYSISCILAQYKFICACFSEAFLLWAVALQVHAAILLITAVIIMNSVKIRTTKES